MLLEAGGQFICVEIGGVVFSVSGGLTGAQWAICLAFGAGEIPWNWLVCTVPADWVPDALLNFDKKLEVGLLGRGGTLDLRVRLCLPRGACAGRWRRR